MEKEEKEKGEEKTTKEIKGRESAQEAPASTSAVKTRRCLRVNRHAAELEETRSRRFKGRFESFSLNVRPSLRRERDERRRRRFFGLHKEKRWETKKRRKKGVLLRNQSQRANLALGFRRQARQSWQPAATASWSGRLKNKNAEPASVIGCVRPRQRRPNFAKTEKSCAQPNWAIYTKLRTARSIPKPPPQAANPTCARLAQQKRSETKKSDCAERCARRPAPTAENTTTKRERSAGIQKRRKTAAPISAPTAMLRQLEDASSQRFKGRFESLSLNIRPYLRKERRQMKAPTVFPNDHEQKSRKEEGKKQGMTRKNKIKGESMEKG